jgi:apolipoprotein D and lipocalin family protein
VRGVAWVVDGRTFAKLTVRVAPAWLSLLPVVWGDYWIIGFAPDYSWAVVKDPGREYLWILARAPHLDDGAAAAARVAARDDGLDVARLVPTPQEGGILHVDPVGPISPGGGCDMEPGRDLRWVV